MTLELAPWMLLGAGVAGAMYAFLPQGMMQRLLGGKGAVLKSVLIGIPLPLCSCAVIPVGLGLKRQGATNGASVAFLIATPQTGVDSILVTAGLLGWPLALFKVATALITGLAGGWITDAVAPAKPGLPIIDKPTPGSASASFAARVLSGVAHADELIRSIWKWLVLGVVISAAITAFVPEGWLAGLGAYGGAAAMGAALAISLPLYVCATASVPIAASLAAAGLPIGAVIVFLMAGPATNAATIGAIYRGLGWRPLAVYLSTIVVGSIAGGLLYESFFSAFSSVWLGGAGLTLTGTDHPHHHHHHGGAWWEVVSAVALIAWIAWCAARDLKKPSTPARPLAEGGKPSCCSGEPESKPACH